MNANKLIENEKTGELWLRFPTGTIQPAQQALSALYLKYEPIDNIFYNDLKNNQLRRFDYFYDVIFIETQRGFIFDKMDKSDDNILKSANNDDRLFLTNAGYKFPDYWLDEKNKKIYISCNRLKEWNSTSVKINVLISQFDIKNNIHGIKTSIDITLNTDYSGLYREPIVEPTKITYNPDTKCFNVSFVSRGNNKEFGLFSIDLKKGKTLKIEQVNCFVPYLKTPSVSTEILINKTLETDFYN